MVGTKIQIPEAKRFLTEIIFILFKYGLFFEFEKPFRRAQNFFIILSLSILMFMLLLVNA